MNYAVIKSGGKQYKVSSGDVILIEKILGESGTKVTFDEVIMMGEGKNIHVEASELKTASVIGEVIEQTRGSKIIVFKKKSKLIDQKNTKKTSVDNKKEEKLTAGIK